MPMWAPLIATSLVLEYEEETEDMKLRGEEVFLEELKRRVEKDMI